MTFGFAHAETHYVSKTGSDIHPYTSWETAALSIQSAIDASSEGDTVLVAPGTYERGIMMKSGVTLIGAGSDVTAIQTGLGIGVTFIGLVRSSIEGFSITVPAASHVSDCGIWLEDSAAVTVRDCTIKGHRNYWRSGAGMHVLRSRLTIRDCTIEQNECSGSYDEPREHAGGGLYAIASELSIENCVVRNNRAGRGGGGGIFLGCAGQACNITNCEIVQNRALYGRGGGVVFYAVGEITGCAIAGNWGGLDGGGIWCGGTVAITDCMISNNAAGAKYGYSYEGDGGGIYHVGGVGCAVVNCVVCDNDAPYGHGGGIYWHANPNVVNSTIVGNGGSGSGAIFVEYPADIYGMHENIMNCVILSNGYAAALQGCRTTYCAIQGGKYSWEGEGNIYVYADTFSAIELPEVVSAGSDSNVTTFTLKEPFGGENQYRHMFANVRYADSQGDWKDHGSFLIAGNAGTELRCYGDASPPSYSVLSLAVTDYGLADDSPCIDAGNNEAEYLPNEDKAGNFRIWRGRDKWRVDMGAYEYGSRRFQIAAVAPTAEPGHLKLTWNSQYLPDKTYSIYLSPDLATWTLVGSNMPSQGETTSWIDPTADVFPSRFYRISSP